jgi:outer membrane protein assembly factor BamB
MVLAIWGKGARLLAVVAALWGLTAAVATGSHAWAPAQISRYTSHPFPDGDWTRFDVDAQRSGVGPAQTGITPHNLGQLRLRRVKLDGTVDSSPIQLHAIMVRGHVRDVVVMTTSYGRTIALDPGSARKLWEFTPSDIKSYEGSGQIMTASPVADPDRRFVYAASPDGMIHKLAVATGKETRSGHWPARVTLEPRREKLSAALNISGPSVAVTTSGYFDVPPYQGHVVLIDRRDGRVTAVWNALCSDRHSFIRPARSCHASDAAIWGRSGAVIEPGSGRILVTTGNAPFNGSTDWGDSVLELSSDGHRLLHNWTPSDQALLNSDDLDLGSTSPAVLPPYHGFRLAVQGGKSHVLNLLDLDRLDGTRGAAGPRLGGELQELTDPGPAQMVTEPAVWTSAGRIYVFVATWGGTAAYTLVGDGKPRLRMAWSTHVPGSSPVLAGGLLYVYDPLGGSLDVYKPTSGRRLISLPVAAGHWNSPIVVGGRVILPTGDADDDAITGQLYIYHLPGR